MRTLLLVGLLSASTATAETVDQIAAVVGDEPIARSEIYDLGADFIVETCPSQRPACIEQAELDILESLILRLLIQQELANLGHDVSAQELRTTLDDIAVQNGFETQAELRAAVEGSGERWDVYREEIREQMRQGRFQNWIIAPRIPVTEDELLDEYRRASRSASGPGKVRFHAITLPIDAEGGPDALATTVMQGRSIWESLTSGELTWEQALAEHHSGAITGEAGDRLPPVSPGDMVGALDTAVFNTELNGIAEPVAASGHVFIVKVVEQMQAEVLPFEQVRQALEEQVKARKAEVEIEQWYQQARRRNAVRIFIGQD